MNWLFLCINVYFVSKQLPTIFLILKANKNTFQSQQRHAWVIVLLRSETAWTVSPALSVFLFAGCVPGYVPAHMVPLCTRANRKQGQSYLRVQEPMSVNPCKSPWPLVDLQSSASTEIVVTFCCFRLWACSCGQLSMSAWNIGIRPWYLTDKLS